MSLGVIVNPVPSSLDVFPSLSVTVVPVGVVTTEFPLLSLTSTLLKLVNSGFNEYVNSFPDCLIFKLSPALNVTVSPALISSTDSVCPVAAAPLPSLPEVAFHAALFIAFTTVSTVVNLSPSPVFDLTFPLLSPSSSIVPFSTSGTVTSTVTVCFPFPSVVALTTALFFPINSTSFAFFTCAENGAVKFPVVLSLETTHPRFFISPTVTALLSDTFGVFKFTNPAALLSAAFIGSKPLFTFDIVFPPAFIPSFVTDTGFLVVSLGVIVNPVPSSLDVFPSASLNSALFKPVNSGFNEYINSFADCLIFKLSPALNVTVSPAFISSSAFPVTVPVPSLPAVAFQPIPFNVVIKSSAVTNLPPSVLAVGTPSVVVSVAVFGVNVIVSPAATTSNSFPSLDFTVNLIPPVLSRSCPVVSVAVSVPF